MGSGGAGVGPGRLHPRLRMTAPECTEMMGPQRRRQHIVGLPQFDTPPAPPTMPEYTFDSILETLASQRQRATYSAVAAVVNSTPRALMQGRPRDPYHSWIVSKQTGQPTGYPDDQVAADLTERPEILTSRDELLAWLSQVQ